MTLRMNDFKRSEQTSSHPLLWVGSLGIGVVLLWQYAGLKQYISPESLRTLSSYFQQTEFPTLTIIAAYMFAGLLFLPVTAMTVLCGLTLPFNQALVASFFGIAGSSLVGYTAGYVLGSDKTKHFPLYFRVNQIIKKNVFLSVLMIRHIPLGPFTLVNMVLGSMRISLVSFVIANGVSFLPAIFLSSLLGESLQ